MATSGASPRTPPLSKRSQQRLTLLELGLLLWVGVVLARLIWLQVPDHAWLEHRALRQQQETVTVEAQRGAIYDRHLTPLAMSLPVVSLFATPRTVAEPRAEAAMLAPILHQPRAAVARVLRSQRRFVWVARQITADQAAAVAALHLPGIGAEPDTSRFYPKGDLAASVLGYVGVDGHGLGGLEHSFDASIHGRDGAAVVEVDAHRQRYSQQERPPTEGENLVLTLDQNIQFIAQQELDKQVAATRALRGVAIVENPHTGEILALANSPSFNPGDYASTPASRLGDPAISNPYEPGSVFKLVTLSAALQQGLVTPDTMINCLEGSIKVGGRIIHDHAPFGWLSVTDILRHSSDVGAIQVGLKLGDQELYKYIKAFGFGDRTGIRLPGESRGLVRPPQRWTPMSIGAVSMGQEVAVTPVQVISMVSALADGGVYHAPRIVMDEFPSSVPATPPSFTPDPGRRVVSPLVANEMKQMMAQVVLAGTAQQAQLNGYTAGGKTGTAQKVDPGTHAYSKRDYIASFAGFAPLNDPAVTILVIIDSPRGGHEGGATAGPVFKHIAERVLPYLGVPHDIPTVTAPPNLRIATSDAVEESQEVDAAPASDLASVLSAPEALTEAASAPNPAAAPTTPQVPAGLVLDYGNSSQGAESSGTITLPNFQGQDLRAVSTICQRLGLDLTIEGSGLAQAQTPAAGARLASGGRVVVRFNP